MTVFDAFGHKKKQKKTEFRISRTTSDFFKKVFLWTIFVGYLDCLHVPQSSYSAFNVESAKAPSLTGQCISSEALAAVEILQPGVLQALSTPALMRVWVRVPFLARRLSQADLVSAQATGASGPPVLKQLSATAA